MKQECRRAECTVVQTGICLLNNEPLTCPERADDIRSEETGAVGPGSKVLDAPKPKPRFPTSLTLSATDAQELTRNRYCCIVGILGAPDAGKTASLVSLYLLLSRASLDGFDFCESRTLQAFEEISRGARRWNDANPPQQMTSHTERPDERTAGFLHLRLRHKDMEEPHDILLPDLPGEWSTSFVDANRADRLDFLKSVDVIWLMVDGRKLKDPPTRMHTVHRTRLMLQRIAELLAPRIPRVTLVISRLDLGKPVQTVLKPVVDEAAQLGIEIRVRHIASFTESSEVEAGTGIAPLICDTISATHTMTVDFWKDSLERQGLRAMLRFRVIGN